MNTWSQDALRKIAEGDDLLIAPFREDGETASWVVALLRQPGPTDATNIS